MRPIPKNLLPHTVTLQKKVNQNRWGKAELSAGEEVCFVRMEPSHKIIRDKNNAEIQLSATLFYDCKNSDPKDIDFREDDIIVFNSQRHSVQIIEPLYDRKKLHHYEVGLIKSG